MKENLVSEYGFLFSEDLINEIYEVGRLVTFDKGQEIIDYGMSFETFPLLLNGAVKILKENDEGQELLLYFLEKGDTCAFSLNCCLGKKKSEIRAEAETAVSLIMIPVENIDKWMCKYSDWRTFVMQSYYGRVNELLDVVDAMAFQQLDQRIFTYLKDKAMVSGTTKLKVTHQEIARDLNSSRVVISRLLKRLENQKIIKISRNQIDLIDF